MNLNELETRIKQEPVTGNIAYGLQDEAQKETHLNVVAVVRELFGTDDIPDSTEELRDILKSLYETDPMPGHNTLLYCNRIADLGDRYLNPDNQVSVPFPPE